MNPPPTGSGRRELGPSEIYRRCMRSPSLWTRLFSNRVAALLVWLVAPWRLVTPNRVTLLSLPVGLFAAWQISMVESTPAALWAVLTLEAYVVLDCVDGQLARLTGRSSSLGRVLDSATDRVVHPMLFIAPGLMLARDGGGLVWVVVGVYVAALHAILCPHVGVLPATVAAAPSTGAQKFGARVHALRSAILAVFGGMQPFFYLGVATLLGAPRAYYVVVAVALSGIVFVEQLARAWFIDRATTAGGGDSGDPRERAATE